MKKILTLLVLGFSLMSFSQTRFIYQVTMKPNSADKSDVKTENAYLDISQNKSVFVAENRVKRDSLFTRMRTTQSFDRTQMQNLRSNIQYTVEKDAAEQTVTFKERIGRDLYTYVEDRPMNWKIINETTKIGDYKAQKAETDFGGRKWIAWFTTDLPFQDGPYKFSRLPGLIVKVEDADGDYSFDLKESKKLAEMTTLDERGNTIKVKRPAFEKQMEKFRKDPMSFFNMNIGAPSPPPGSGSGRGMGMRFQQDPQRMKEMEARIKEEIKKNDNTIELIK